MGPASTQTCSLLQERHWPSSLSSTALQFPLHVPVLPLQLYCLLQRLLQKRVLLHAGLQGVHQHLHVGAGHAPVPYCGAWCGA